MARRIAMSSGDSAPEAASDGHRDLFGNQMSGRIFDRDAIHHRRAMPLPRGAHVINKLLTEAATRSNRAA